ncbi:hypothetical protein B0H34DRAFT_667731 [Crassisporium funariophilum]|nr:hypothetical protein B0H34DRAFT_667731 [Crassisporium funariophilum]
MATKYGLPIFLEDKTGRLTGSEFVDIHERMRLAYRCTVRDAARTVYGVFDLTSGASDAHRVPVISLQFGSDNSLGTVTVGSSQAIQMTRYLSVVNIFAGSKLRRFFASDGKEYRWGYRLTDDHEWSCTNSSGQLVAYYNLKHPGEPEYYGSSGCMLSVEEAFGHLAPEMLATMMIMRNILAYDL